MTAVYTYPGLYIREQKSDVVSVSQVATSIALFIGMTRRGVMNRPTRVQSYTEFQRTFGSDATVGEMPDQVRQFFLNGGGDAYAMRIADGEQTATVALANELGGAVFTFAAREAGSIGETIRFEIDYETSQPEATFNLTVYRIEPDRFGNLRRVAGEDETYKDLEPYPGAPRFISTVLDHDSRLLSATFVGAAAPVIRGYSLGGIIDSTAALLDARVQTALANVAARTGVANAPGRFEISVDGLPFAPVSVSALLPNLNGIQAAITATLAGTGAAVNVAAIDLPGGAPNTAMLIRIESAAAGAGRSVRIRSVAARDDIAAELRLGFRNGGLEVDGATALRPMANGFVAALGTTAGGLEAVGALLREAQANFTLQLADGLAGSPFSTSVTMPPPFAGAQFFDGLAANQRSLTNGQANIESLRAALQSILPARYVTILHGLRIIVRSPDAASDFGPVVAVTGGLASFSEYFRSVQAAGTPRSRANVAAYRPGGYGALGPFANGAVAGADGAFPKPIHYTNAYDVVRRDVDIFNLLVLPKAVGQNAASHANLWAPASVFCQSRRAVLLMDPPEWNSAAMASTDIVNVRQLGVVPDYTALYWPRVVISDPTTGLPRTIDPAGTVAGVCARVDASRGVWKGPAGIEARLTGVPRLALRMSDDENGLINPQAINGLRVFPDGIVVWGARTVAGWDNSGETDYRYLPVRRTALMIEESLYRGLRFAIFMPNDEALWAMIRLAAGAFMNGLFRRRAFQGERASDAYFVKCDGETTTQTDRNLGICNVVVGFAALRPAEFIVLTVRQMAGQIQT